MITENTISERMQLKLQPSHPILSFCVFQLECSGLSRLRLIRVGLNRTMLSVWSMASGWLLDHARLCYGIKLILHFFKDCSRWPAVFGKGSESKEWSLEEREKVLMISNRL